MLHTIVPMDQIFPTETQSERPDGQTAAPNGAGIVPAVLRGVSLTAEAASGGAMAKLDRRTALGQAFSC